MNVYQPLKFYGVTFLITWSAWFGAAAIQDPFYQTVLLLIGLVAPFGTAIGLTKGHTKKALFLNKLCNLKRIQWSTFPFTLLLMPAVVILSIVFSLLFGGSPSQFRLAETFSFSAGILPVFFILFLAATFEELGWRGYAIEGLQMRYCYFTATLLFTVLWSLWHFPLFFIENAYPNTLYKENVWFALNFMIGIIPLGFIIGWFYRKNQESILFAMLFHFAVNLSQEAFQLEPETKCIETGVLTVIALIIIWMNRDIFFKEVYTDRDSRFGFMTLRKPRDWIDRKRPNIKNIRTFTIVQAREISLCQKQNLESRSV